MWFNEWIKTNKTNSKMKKLFKIKRTKNNEIVVITDEESPKENTNTFSQGINGDLFWCSKWNSIACTGDITPFDFKVIAFTQTFATDFPTSLPKLSEEFVNEWFNNRVEEIEVEVIPTHVIDKDGFEIPYAFETGDKVIYGPKVNDNNEIICSIPKSKLDLNKLEQKLDKALENETVESLRNWLLDVRALSDEQILSKEIVEAGENYCVGLIGTDNLFVLRGFIEGAKSEAAKNYWPNKLEPYFRESFKEGNDSAEMPNKWTDHMEKYFKNWFTQTFKINNGK